MRIYRVKYDGSLGHVNENDYEGCRFFGSHGEARKWCNGQIREALARWKEYDGVTRLADVGWGAEITIASLEAVNVTKAVLVDLLDWGVGLCSSEGRIPDGLTGPPTVVEVWNPQDKWHKPQEGEE